MTHTPTPQQHAAYNITSDPRGGSLAIDAKAGTGKTSTLKGVACLLPGSGLATSFSKSTVTDLSEAMPSNWDAKGMHSLGFQAIRQRLPQAKVDSRGNAAYQTIKDLLADETDGWKVHQDVKRLLDIAQLSGITPDHERFVLADTPENWEALADSYDLEYTPLIYHTARETLTRLNRLALEGNITFNHMLTLPLFWNFPVRQYPKIIVDEAQDLNILQHLLVEQALRPGGRVFIAGDPNQAIYAFSGALSDSFYRLVDRFDATIRPLTVSWRCARSIIREAQQYVPDIEAAPNAPEGLVIDHPSIDIETLPRTIICRNNAPPVRLSLHLFVRGFSVEIAGKKDVGAGLKSTISRVASGKSADKMPSEKFTERLRAWAEREIARRPARRPAVHDKVEALSALAEHYTTVGRIRRHLEQLYVDPDSGKRRPAQFHLSTIHKAKGREWDRVAFLDPELLPAPWAKQETQQQQERNLAYVGTTRAKTELHYVHSNTID